MLWSRFLGCGNNGANNSLFYLSSFYCTQNRAEEGHQAVVRANIAALMDEYEIPKDKADQMYSEYEGKEEELLSFLKKMGEDKRTAAIAAAAAEAESKDEE